MSAPPETTTNDAAPPTSPRGPGTCDPRWNASWAFRLLKVDDTAAMIHHYRLASAYWHKAYVASQANYTSLAAQLEAVWMKLENIEAKLHGDEIHALREALVRIDPYELRTID